MLADRDAMLLAFKTQEEVLTRHEIMSRANVKDKNQFESLRNSGLVAQCEWRGAVHPREYVLSPKGMDRRDMARGLG